MKLSEIYEKFTRLKETEGRSPNTMRTYDIVVLKLFIYDHCNDMDHKMLSLALCEDYIYQLQQRDDISPNTIVSYRRHIKVFLNYMYDQELLDRPISKKLPKVRSVRKHVIILDDDEILYIFNTLTENTERDWRKRSIFALMLDAALRPNEICSLELSDIDLNRRTIKIRGEVSKGKADRILQISLPTRKILESYLMKRREIYQGDNKELFFVNEDGRQLSVRSIRTLVENHVKSIGIKRAYPYIFRHTAITRWCLYTDNTFKVQMYAGHKDLSTTRNYFHDSAYYDEMLDRYRPIPELFTLIRLPRISKRRYVN